MDLRTRSVPQEGLLVDLDADHGVDVDPDGFVSSWRNRVTGGPGPFVSRDEGRTSDMTFPLGPQRPLDRGSGRPLPRRDVAELDGHSSLVFRECELVELEGTAIRPLLSGAGFTWFVVIIPYAQIGIEIDVNVFLGNLRNGRPYDGLWGGLTDDNRAWSGYRNGQDDGASNPKAIGPHLERNRPAIVGSRLAAGVGTVPLKLFVDSGTAAATEAVEVHPDVAGARLAIGQERDAIDHPGFEAFDGELARVLIWERPLSDREIHVTVNALKLTYLHGTPWPG